MENMNVLFKVIKGGGRFETPKGEVDGQDLTLGYYLSFSLLSFLFLSSHSGFEMKRREEVRKGGSA